MTVSNFLSRQQAEHFCKDYQFLVGQPLENTNEMNATIDCIAVAPADEFNRYVFYKDYRSCFDPEQALNQYLGNLFGVVIIARPEGDSEQLIFKDLSGYLIENSIDYDSSKYSD